jgi:glycosyltransferase involved in cell wall biosynthesis
VTNALSGQDDFHVTIITNNKGGDNEVSEVHQEELNCLTESIELCIDKEIDIFVLVHDGSRMSKAIAQKAAKYRIPCVVWAHNTPNREFEKLYSKNKHVKRLICVSKIQSDRLRDRPIFDKTEVIYNPLPVEKYTNKDCIERVDGRVCYVGAIKKSKGLDKLINVWPDIKDEVPGSELLVIGSAALYDKNAELGPLNVGKKHFEERCLIPVLGDTRSKAESMDVKFMGLMSPTSIREVLHTSTVGVVNPSTNGSGENCSVSSLEIQATGTPVVGGRWKGLRETVKDKKTGLLVRSESQLKNAICKLLRSPNICNGMGSAGVEWVNKNFRTEKVIQDWRKMLIRVENGEPARPPEFSLSRSTLKNASREIIRLLRLHLFSRSEVFDQCLDTVRKYV